MIKRIILLLGLLLIFLCGVWVASYYYGKDRMRPEEQSVILLEQIKKVSKLVTVEGHFVEYYDYTEPKHTLVYWPSYSTIALSYQPKRPNYASGQKCWLATTLNKCKSMLFRTNKSFISPIFHDLILLRSIMKLINLTMKRRFFRPLESADYVRIDKGAQEKIRELAMTSELIDSAKAQGNDMATTHRIFGN